MSVPVGGIVGPQVNKFKQDVNSRGGVGPRSDVRGGGGDLSHDRCDVPSPLLNRMTDRHL